MKAKDDKEIKIEIRDDMTVREVLRAMIALFFSRPIREEDDIDDTTGTGEKE